MGITQFSPNKCEGPIVGMGIPTHPTDQCHLFPIAKWLTGFFFDLFPDVGNQIVEGESAEGLFSFHFLFLGSDDFILCAAYSFKMIVP